MSWLPKFKTYNIFCCQKHLDCFNVPHAVLKFMRFLQIYYIDFTIGTVLTDESSRYASGRLFPLRQTAEVKHKRRISTRMWGAADNRVIKLSYFIGPYNSSFEVLLEFNYLLIFEFMVAIFS